jgi:hypothetical protein
VLVSETLDEESVQDRPVEGKMDELRATVPAKEFRDSMVTTDVPETPVLTLRLFGFATIEKSGMAML